MPILNDLIAALASGRIRVVDLTQPLGPDTPVIGLPPVFASSPGVTLDVISRYDEKGPAWYWNTIRMGKPRCERASGPPISTSQTFTGMTVPPVITGNS